MIPSESSIHHAIDQLKRSPGVFQNLVEGYARLSSPTRRINPSGRNRDNVTVKGWPDAWALLPDGRMEAIEAVHSPDWRRHLDDDVRQAKAKPPGTLGGFLFIAWAPSPPQDEVRTLQNQFAEQCGIPPQNVTFVFQKQLVSELRQPRFAGLWVDPLGISPSVFPFQLIERAPVFGHLDRVGAFAPTREEYAANLVCRPVAADEVAKRLDTQGWALVRGRGASGKTILATLMGLDHINRRGPAYYLDLARGQVKAQTFVPQTIEAMTQRADSEVLFILDNVHLDDETARVLFDHWQQLLSDSRLLMFGRHVTNTAGYDGLAQPLEALESGALNLEVTAADLVGVFLRLARRGIPSSEEVPLPSQQVAQEWLELFGGDLVAFSFAIANCMGKIQTGNWRLRATDAASYVRRAYLEELGDGERSNLLMLAALATLEVDPPEQSLASAGLEESLRAGVVHRSEHGDGRFARFHLVHPGLGDLLLVAGGLDQAATLDSLVDAAQRSGFCGTLVAARLESAGRTDEARRLLKRLAASDRWPVGFLLESGFQFTWSSIDRIVRLEVTSLSDIEERLIGDDEALRSAALRTPLHFLMSFFRIAQRNLPLVYNAALRRLEEPESTTQLALTALRTPLHFLVAFLQWSEHKLPNAHASISNTITEARHFETLLETSLRSPLTELVPFLEYTKRRLPNLHVALEEALLRPRAVDRLAVTACRSGLDGLVRLLRYKPLAAAVVSAIDVSAWERTRLVTTGQPDYLPGLADALYQLKRPELAEAPARALILRAEPREWHSSNIVFEHVSRTLRLGNAVGREALLRFLDRVVTSEWLIQQYRAASSGALAASLRRIWASCDEDVWMRFRIPALTSRIASEIRKASSHTNKDLSGAIQLLGCSALMGEDLSAERAEWPDESQVRELLQFAAPKPDSVAIGYIQAQLWTGLREMTRIRKNVVAVPGSAAEKILTLWMAATPVTAREKALNLVMVEWLQACSLQGWNLVIDTERLDASVNQRLSVDG